MSTATDANPIDVFISYSSADVTQAESLQTLLQGRGLKVWRDRTELAPGDPYIVHINAALDKAARVIVLWSERSVKSHWVLGEAEKARSAGKIITLRLDATALPAPFNVLHTEALDNVLANGELIVRALGTAKLANGGLYIPATQPRLDVSRLPTTYATRLFGRDAEMADLYRAWDTSGASKTNVLVLDAMGGTGKTALINHFVQGLSTQSWRGAETVFVWSFYSQGTDEKRQASADEFFKAALSWFGHTGDMPTTPNAKGVRLAELIASKRSLVILDGLEPLQHGPSRRAGGNDAGLTGGLKDQGLVALLKQLARGNPGLIIVTTRLRVPDLRGFPEPAVINERLGPIPTHDGVELIRSIGVVGKYEEMRELVEDLNGHAIALTQVATWLKSYRDGDVRCRDELPSLVDLGGDNERDPFRVMMTYEAQFKREIEEQIEKGKPIADIAAAKQLGLLFLMGLFDRPMERGDREALMKPPAIPGITESLSGLTPSQLDYAVGSLRELGLLLPKDKDTPDELDAHPLVREYFGLRLERELPEAWRAAHGRLYDYYRFRGLPKAYQNSAAYGLLAIRSNFPNVPTRSAVDGILSGNLRIENAPQFPRSIFAASKEEVQAAGGLIDGPGWEAALAAFLPETEDAMQPLFAAISHGCAANRHDEALKEVYMPRIARGNEQFAVKKLGLHGSNLSALAHFFSEPFARPEPSLMGTDQALMLNLAGYALRALGRLGEAVEPMRASVALSIEQGELGRAGDGSENLGELLLTLGKVAEAEETANTAVAYQDQTDREFDQMSARTGHADTRLAAGAWEAAGARFAEAERMQRKWQPELPLLYSVQGYLMCDMRLAKGRAREVSQRAAYALDVVKRGSMNLLDIGLSTLSLGRAAHHLAISSLAGKPDGSRLPYTAEAAAHLHEAVEGLRAAGASHHITRGLLARAAFHRELPSPIVDSHRLAAADLTEAFEIAERAGMRLFQAEAWIERARQILSRANPDQTELTAARSAIDKAAALVAETGYHRRDPDLALARAELALVEGDGATGQRHIDALVAMVTAHDLWMFLPQIERLSVRFRLGQVERMLDGLRTVRARFDAAADKEYDEARRRADGLDDEVIDARLADDEFRATLARAMRLNEMPDLDGLPIEAQRDYARHYILQFERNQSERQPNGGEKTTVNPSDIPEQLVTEMLADAKFREMIDEIHGKAGMPVLEELSLAGQKEAARAFLAAMMEARANDEAKSAPEPEPEPRIDPASIPDHLVDKMLTDPESRAFLAKVLQENGHDINRLAPSERRVAARQLIAQINEIEAKRQAAEQAAPAPARAQPLPPPAPTPPRPPQGGGNVLSRFFGGLMRRN